MNKLVTVLALLALSTGVSLAANQNPDRDPTRGFATDADKSEMTLDTNHAASLPVSEAPRKKDKRNSARSMGSVHHGRAANILNLPDAKLSNHPPCNEGGWTGGARKSYRQGRLASPLQDGRLIAADP